MFGLPRTRSLSTKVPIKGVNYSKTLHLPKSAFGPKIPKGKDRDLLIQQSSQALYSWQEQQSRSSSFTLHDGPPYANGDLHLGHSLNKILKDIINRFELIQNNSKINYRPGWDCHGLPIEMKATNLESSIKKKSNQTQILLAVEIRAACRALATSMIDLQRQQFKEFAILTDFETPYITMDHKYEVNQLRIFQKLMENGLLSRQLKPVWWGCETQTALAEAELDYKNDHKSVAIYVKFPVVNPQALNLDNLSVLIWTSTPWTIPANKAICVNKEFTYTVLTNGKENIIVAQDLADQLLELDSNWSKTHHTFQGNELLRLKYNNPSLQTDEIFPILHGDHVVASAGSGLVHTAPAHGGDDYLLGKTNGLVISSCVDSQGRYVENVPTGYQSLKGEKVTESKTIWKVIELLQGNNMIFHINKNFKHSYPYDWRSKTPVIQRATPQWFVNVEKIKATALAALENVKFYPESGRNRLPLFINNRNEWCISRQRSWGVPLPIIYHKVSEEPLVDEKSINQVISKIEEYGTDEWFVVEEDISRWLPEELKSKGDQYVKGKDTMDVWFDSGTSWSTLKPLTETLSTNTPIADIYLEGSDQHRGWFQSSLLNKIIASGTNGENFKPVAPFKKIITHGFTLDSKNDKMSKSLGNFISPTHAIEGGGKPFLPSLGTDGLRLWAASSNYTSDVNVTTEVLTRVFENVKKLRVTFKYMLGNLNEFSHPVEYQDLNPFDKYALSKLYRLQHNCVEFYKEHNFSRVVAEINYHMNSDLSALYFDISKDCLYTDLKDSHRRRSIQTVLNELVRTYIGILAPIQPLLTQEVWNEYKQLINRDEESPFMLNSKFYQLRQEYLNEEIEDEFIKIWTVRDAVYKQLEELRLDGTYKNKLELQINLNFKEGSMFSEILLRHEQFLDDYFLVSNVTINKTLCGEITATSVTTGEENIEIQIGLSDNAKCPRCWKFIAPEPEILCKKCEKVVNHEM